MYVSLCSSLCLCGVCVSHGQLHIPRVDPETPTDETPIPRKFGKHIQKRQLEVPEYAASFVNYKALKKVRVSYQNSET